MYRLDMGIHIGALSLMGSSGQLGIHKHSLMNFRGNNNQNSIAGRHFDRSGCYMFLLCTLLGKRYLLNNSDQQGMVLQMMRHCLGLALKSRTDSKILGHIFRLHLRAHPGHRNARVCKDRNLLLALSECCLRTYP